MSFTRQHGRAKHIAKQLELLKDQLLSRWREQVRRDPEQAAEIHRLDDKELEDHLPALANKIITALETDLPQDLDQDAAKHGRQRRALGYSVVPLLRELQIFRRVLIGMIREIVGTEVSAEETEHALELVVDTIDRSMNV